MSHLPRLLAAAMLAATGAAAWAQSPPPATDAAATALAELTRQLGTYVAVLAGTAGLVVALLEAYKKLFSIRGKFHRTAVMRWLSQNSGSIPPALQLARPGLLSAVLLGGGSHYDVPAARAATQVKQGGGTLPYDAGMAYAELFHLTSGQALPAAPHPLGAVLRWRGVDRAVFELDTSRMMSQVQDAADSVLNNPDLYPHLYAFLTRGADPADSAGWRSFVLNPPAHGAAKTDTDRYARVRMLMRRQLDGFQTVTSSRWEDLNKMWAMLAGAALLFVALVIASDPAFSQGPLDPWRSLSDGWGQMMCHSVSLLGVLLKAVLGGVLAPVAKDLLNGLSSVRFTK
ncbi:MAG TPA: hypothetical protein VGF12_21630 [Roseateles sp.]|uniref:hypothetical protein n=1 Tax=Roseateles sp. TaxID=1971397 RepID=UPI002ED9966F